MESAKTNCKFERINKIEAIVDKDFLLDARRNAYIECTENYLSCNTIAGIFGDNMPEELFYACGTIPVPMEGVDSHIFKFGKEGYCKDSCDVIKSTLLYLTTQKCPILYSCKMYVVQNNCQKFIDAIKANCEKPVLVYSGADALLDELCKIYGTRYDEILMQDAKADLQYIKTVLQKAKFYSNLTCEEFFLLESYSKYMTNLKIRRAYFEELEKKLPVDIEPISGKCEIKEVSAFCPRGNYEKICKDLNSMYCSVCKDEKTSSLRIKRVWDKAIYGYDNCPFDCEKKVGY